jgi:FSR family fosmidomycin resistance protein-like MFS transporter
MKSRRNLGILIGVHAANDFYTGAVAALLPFFVLHRHYDYAAAAGITLAATSLSSLAQPIVGHLSDKHRIRWVVLAGLATAAIGVGLSGLLAGTYWATWVVIAISGIGVAAFHPPATMAAREAGGGTNQSMSFFSVGGNIGAALAPTAVLVTVGAFGLTATPLLAIPAAVFGALFLLRQRPPRPAAAPAAGTPAAAAVDPAAAATTATAATAPRPLRDNWKLFRLLIVILAFWSVAYVGTSSFVSLLSIQRFGVTPGAASIALTVFPAAGAAGTIAGGWLADRVGRLRTIRAGYALAVLAVLVVTFAPSQSVVVVATGILGFALFIPFPGQITLSHSYLPNRIGLASGATLGLTLSLGGFLSPVLGTIADATSVQVAFVIMSCSVAAAFALSFLLRERRDAIVDVVTEPATVEVTAS